MFGAESCHDEHGQQGGDAHGQGAQHEPGAKRQHRTHAGYIGRPADGVFAGAAHHDRPERGSHAPLGEGGAGRRTGNAPADRVDEQPVQHNVYERADRGDLERGDGVLQSAERADLREDNHHRRNTPQRMVQVVQGVAHGFVGRAEAAQQRVCEGVSGDHEEHAEAEGDPHAVHTDLPGAAQVLLAEGARHGRRDGVSEEVHEAHDRGDERGGDAHARELRFAELTDEGGIGEHEDGFGDERAEGGYGEREDAPVQRRRSGVRSGVGAGIGTGARGGILRGRAGCSIAGFGATGFSIRVLLCAHPSRLLPAAAAGACARGGVHSTR